MPKAFDPEKWKNWKWDETPEDFSCTSGTSGLCTGDLTAGEQNFIEYADEAMTTPNGGALCQACAKANGIPLDWDAVIENEETDNVNCLGCGIEICEVCSVCHTEDCPFIERKVLTAGMKSKYAFLTAKTQKVKGYVTLAEAGLNVPKPYRVIINKEDIEPAVRAMKGEDRFIRPCPMRPRHGFVDSRPIEVGLKSIGEITDLLNKACEADEQGHAELLLVPYIKSIFNAIVTPTRVAIGPGHDGATGGHGSMSFPLAGVPFKQITPEILAKAHISKIDDPYIEAVISKTRAVYFTQIRAGVKIAPTVGLDFVPKPVRVTEVIDASGDLLEWEAQTKQIQEGTVVCHIGGTLISHYGVHCMQNDIPVFTSRRPEVGEVLEVLNKVEKPNPEAVIRGLGAGAIVPLDVDGVGLHNEDQLAVANALIAMMIVLHNSAAMSGEDGFWLGVATSIMYRAGMAASHGEARHKITGMATARNTVYKLAFKNFFDGRETLGRAQWRFQNSNWSSGYGGSAWAKCTQAILDMDDCIRILIQNRDQASVAALIVNLNNAVNQAHNGGWWLNKFIIQKYFTMASEQNLETVVVGAASMFRIRQLLEGKMGDAEALVELWGQAGAIKVVNGKLQVQLEYASKGKALEDVGEADKGWEEPYKPATKPADPEYIGVFCEHCGNTFPDLEKNDVDAGLKCGKTLDYSKECSGYVGFYDSNGLFSFPIPTPYSVNIEDEDSYEDSENAEEPAMIGAGECNCSECTGKPGEVSEAVKDKEIPPVNLITPFTNMNSAQIPEGAKVTSAQCQLGKGDNQKVFMHLQYRVDNQDGYHSCDALVKNVDLKASKVFMGFASYSGSNKTNYMLLAIYETEDPQIFELKFDEVKLSVYLNLKSNSLWETSKWEVKVEPKVETAEQTQKGLEEYDEIPF